MAVPVIKDANLMELESLDAAVSELASKARSKKLRNNDLEGSTFTVSSLENWGFRLYSYNQPARSSNFSCFKYAKKTSSSK